MSHDIEIKFGWAGENVDLCLQGTLLRFVFKMVIVAKFIGNKEL